METNPQIRGRVETFLFFFFLKQARRDSPWREECNTLHPQRSLLHPQNSERVAATQRNSVWNSFAITGRVEYDVCKTFQKMLVLVRLQNIPRPRSQRSEGQRTHKCMSWSFRYFITWKKHNTANVGRLKTWMYSDVSIPLHIYMDMYDAGSLLAGRMWASLCDAAVCWSHSWNTDCFRAEPTLWVG